METEWYCKIRGQEMGPLSSRDLVELARSGRLTEKDLVRRRGNNKWIRAREVKDLFRLADGGEGTDDETEEPSGQVIRGAASRRLLLGGGIVIAAAAVIVGALVWRSGGTSPDSGLPPGNSQSEDAAKLTATFTQDFREQFQPRFLELFGGSRPDQLVKVEPRGFRVRIPEDSEVTQCGVSPRVVVKGDFEITASFTIIDLPPPTDGFGTGLQLYIEDPRRERASVTRLHRIREGHIIGSYRGIVKEDGSHQHDVVMKKDARKSGWMRLKRVGTKIQFHVANLDSEKFTQIHETQFTAENVVMIRLLAQTGGSPTSVDCVWTYLEIRAEELDDGTERSAKPKTPLVWAVVVILLILSSVAVFLVLRLRAKRRAKPRPDNQTADTTKHDQGDLP